MVLHLQSTGHILLLLYISDRQDACIIFFFGGGGGFCSCKTLFSSLMLDLWPVVCAALYSSSGEQRGVLWGPSALWHWGSGESLIPHISVQTPACLSACPSGCLFLFLGLFLRDLDAMIYIGLDSGRNSGLPIYDNLVRFTLLSVEILVEFFYVKYSALSVCYVLQKTSWIHLWINWDTVLLFTSTTTTFCAPSITF